MSESKREASRQGEPAQRKTAPPGKHLRERSRIIAALQYNPSIRNHRIRAGFPRVGEEIQLDMGDDRILVFKYRGAGRDDNLIFKWVGTVS